MTAAEWVELGRTTYSEDLHLSDVFPLANHAADWIQIDAPVPTLQAWANGADQDITTLESEMDAAEARLTALEANPGGVSAPPKRLKVFCDANYAGENGNADGSMLKPYTTCLLYTSPSPRDGLLSRMPSSA